MKKKNYLPTFFLFLALYITGTAGSYAQHTKELSVKKITCTVSPESEAVPALLDQHHIAYHPLDRVNWKDYPLPTRGKFPHSPYRQRNPASL